MGEKNWDRHIVWKCLLVIWPSHNFTKHHNSTNDGLLFTFSFSIESETNPYCKIVHDHFKHDANWEIWKNVHLLLSFHHYSFILLIWIKVVFYFMALFVTHNFSNRNVNFWWNFTPLYYINDLFSYSIYCNIILFYLRYSYMSKYLTKILVTT